MTTKEKLHRLVDALPEAELRAAERYLEYLHATSDPVLRAFLSAPMEDEEIGAEVQVPIQGQSPQALARAVLELQLTLAEVGWWAATPPPGGFRYVTLAVFRGEGRRREGGALPVSELDRPIRGRL